MKLNALTKVLAMSKFFIYMACLQAVFATIALANDGNAQALEEVKINYDWKNAKLEQAFADIQNQTDYFFTYTYENVADIRISSQSERVMSLADMLKLIASQTSLRFSIQKDIIYVFEDENLTNSKTKSIKIEVPTTETLSKLLTKLNDQVIYKVAPANLRLDQIVRGTVTSTDGELLIGAAVVVKETGQGTVTDNSGNFTIAVPDEGAATLVVSYIGYQTTEVRVSGQTQIDIQLAVASAELDEVVVIGYGTQSRANVTSAVSKLSADQINNQPNTGFEQNIVGRLPGVNVQQTTGTPGGNVSIRIRGTGSITAGNEPLIVIDGFPVSDSYNTSSVQGSRPSNATRRENPQNPLNTLNPNDIESIEVLKDAAAAAIYGSRGANGVILITTKKGTEGEAQINFNSYVGGQRIINTYDLMDAYTFAEQNYIARVNGGTDGGYPQEFIPYLNDEPGLVDTDWQDALFRDAAIQNYDLSVRGGNSALKYYVSGNYFSQDGIIIGSGFERFSLRSNLEGNISDRLKITLNVNPSLTQSDLVPAENPYFVDGVVNLALLSIPTDPIYNPDGSFNFNQNTALGSGPFVNPIALATGVEDDLNQFRFLGNLKVEAKILDNLTFATSFGADVNSFNRDYYRPSWIPVRGAPLPSDPEARSFTTNILNWVNENTLNYKLAVGPHSFNFLAGITLQKERINRSGLFANNFPNDLVTTINAGTVNSGFTQVQEWSLFSYLSRLIYDFDNKYIVNLSIRRDGSSRFGQDTKWGYFPSASVGWRISNERFFPASSAISDLKLRASIGQTGNFSIPNYGAVALLEPANYVLDNQPTNGLAPDTSPNADLSWEKTTMTNFGLDAGFFQNKLIVNADYFISNTEDLLINLPVPGTSGFSTSLQNIGEVENRGFELGVTGNFNIGQLRWSLNANIATLQNEVISLGQSDEPIITSGGVPNTHITQVGSPIGSYFGYNVLGVFQNEAQLSQFPALSDAQPGDFIFEDVNGDGIISPADRTIIGDFFPDYTFGFSSQFAYKNFDLSFLIQGSQGFEVFHLAQRYLGSLQTFSNYRADIYQDAYFSESDPGNGQIYRPNSNPTNDNDAISSYHVEDGSFIRVRNITLGYTFSGLNNGKRLPFQNLRLYATAQNPFTITDYPGYNPEVNMRPEDPLSQGEDYGTYPLAKSLIFGINLSF